MPRCKYRSTKQRSRYLPSDCKWCIFNGKCDQQKEWLDQFCSCPTEHTRTYFESSLEIAKLNPYCLECHKPIRRDQLKENELNMATAIMEDIKKTAAEYKLQLKEIQGPIKDAGEE